LDHSYKFIMGQNTTCSVKTNALTDIYSRIYRYTDSWIL